MWPAKHNILKWNEHKQFGALVPLGLSSLAEGQQMKVRFSSLLNHVCENQRARKKESDSDRKHKTECETLRGFLPKHNLHITESESGEKCFCVCCTRPELKLHPFPNIITGSNFPQSSMWRRSEWGLVITLQQATSKPPSTVTHFSEHIHLDLYRKPNTSGNNCPQSRYEHLSLLQAWQSRSGRVI